MPDDFIISIIAALDDNNLIGKSDSKNGLPWHLPADIERFKNLTLHKPIVMGKTTFEAIGKPLPERTNLILSKDKNFKSKGCIVVYSIEEAIEKAKTYGQELMVCGGKTVYEQFLPLANNMYLTFIHHGFEGDIYFPDFEQSQWRETFHSDFLPDSKNFYPYSFVVWKKVRQ